MDRARRSQFLLKQTKNLSASLGALLALVVNTGLLNIALGSNPITSGGPSLPSLSLKTDQRFISESAGRGAAQMTVTRPADSTNFDQPLEVNLSSSDATELRAPSSVTIAAGKESATFDLDAVDDTEVDGGQKVKIIASATGFSNGEIQIRVTDNESLVVTVAPDTFSEGDGASAATATVTRSNTDQEEALTVTLSSSDVSEAAVPSSVTIPAGKPSVTFGIDAVNDSEVDGNQKVGIHASEPRYVSVPAGIVVTDDEAATDVSSVTVVAIEYLDLDKNKETKNLVKLLNATPFVEITGLPNGQVGPEITVTAKVKDPLAPIEMDHITIGGASPDTASQPVWDDSNKWFERTFTRRINVGDFSSFIKVVARNSVGNIGVDSLSVTTTRDEDESIAGREAENNASLPGSAQSAQGREFRLQVTDKSANVNSAVKDKLSASVGSVLLDLEETGEDTNVFQTTFLVAVPENFVRPTGFSPDIQQKVNQRIPVSLGSFLTARYATDHCKDEAIPLGVLLLGPDGKPIDGPIQAGNRRDDSPLGLAVGHDGNDGTSINIIIESRDGLDQKLNPVNDVRFPAARKRARPRRQSNDPKDPKFNLFLLPPGEEILPMNSMLKTDGTPASRQHLVRIGGAIEANDPVTELGARESITAMMGVVIGVDGARSRGVEMVGGQTQRVREVHDLISRLLGL